MSMRLKYYWRRLIEFHGNLSLSRERGNSLLAAFLETVANTRAHYKVMRQFKMRQNS
jgi:hypothetical protein